MLTAGLGVGSIQKAFDYHHCKKGKKRYRNKKQVCPLNLCQALLFLKWKTLKAVLHSLAVPWIIFSSTEPRTAGERARPPRARDRGKKSGRESRSTQKDLLSLFPEKNEFKMFYCAPVTVYFSLSRGISEKAGVVWTSGVLWLNASQNVSGGVRLTEAHLFPTAMEPNKTKMFLLF